MDNLINKIKAFNTKQKIVSCLASIIILGIMITIVVISTKKDSQNIQLKKETFIVEFGKAYSYKKEHYIKADKETMKDVRVVIEGADLDQTPLATMTKEQVLKKYAIGTYKGTAQYKDETVSFKIVIKDTTKPEFTDFKDKIEVTKDSADDLAKHFTAKDLSESSIVVDSSKVDFAVPGEYKATAKATDVYKNKVQKEFAVIVGEKSQAEIDAAAQVQAEQEAQQAQANKSSTTDASNQSGNSTVNNNTNQSNQIGDSNNSNQGNSNVTGGGNTTTPTPPAPSVCDQPVGNSGRWFASEAVAGTWADSEIWNTSYSGYYTWGNSICGYTVQWY